MTDSFGKVNKQQWLDKVTADLKGRPIEELDFQLGQRLVSPFYSNEDVVEAVSFPSTGKVQLSFELNVNDSIQDNQILLEELNGGAGHLYLNFQQTWDGQFEKLFEGIFLEMISLVLTGLTKDDLDGFRAFLKSKYGDNHPEGISVVGLEGGLESDGIQPASRLELSHDDSIEEQLICFLKNAHSGLLVNRNGQNLYVTVGLGHNFYENVILLRSIRILWRNLILGLGLEEETNQMVLTSGLAKNQLDSDKYANMIALSQVAVSAMVGTSDLILIPASDSNERNGRGSEFTRRISRNVFNLMTLESHLGQVKDPSKGSYFFDSQTHTYSKRAWESFISEIEHEENIDSQ